MQRALDEGAQVAIADIDVAAGNAVAGATPGGHFVQLDVTSDASWAAAIDDVEKHFGMLDGVVNSAGIFIIGDIERISLEDWHKTHAVNLDGVFLGCRHAVRAMKARGGSIVNMSSVSGLIGGHNVVAYNSSKGAVRLLTKSVALHCAKKNTASAATRCTRPSSTRRCTSRPSRPRANRNASARRCCLKYRSGVRRSRARSPT